MRVIVTGANGFVGTHLVRHLMDAHEVLAIDSLRYGPWRFAPSEMAEFNSDTTDLRDRQNVERVVKGFRPDAIIHLAAIHFIPECERLPDEAVSTNVLATVNLLLASPEHCRFVYTSSAAVYQPIETAHREHEDPTGPVDAYGFSKLHGEDFVGYLGGRRELRSIVVRLFNVIGSGETNPHVLPEIIKQLKAGKRTLQLGNVEPKRDYVYVQDVVEGFTATVTAPFPKIQSTPVVVNLGTGKSYSVREIVGRLSRIIGDPINIETDPKRVRKVDRPNLLSDSSRIRELFAWSPRVELDEALERIWENPDFGF
jgi:UDP-glucose 4-epimerase